MDRSIIYFWKIVSELDFNTLINLYWESDKQRFVEVTYKGVSYRASEELDRLGL